MFENNEKLTSAFFQSIALNTGISEVDTFVAENSKKTRQGVILFIDPNQSNKRLVMQQGLFMFPYTLDKNNHLSVINKNTHTIMISKELRSDLLAYLDTIGINAFRIMPDLPSVCEAVERKVKERRFEKSLLFKKRHQENSI